MTDVYEPEWLCVSVGDLRSDHIGIYHRRGERQALGMFPVDGEIVDREFDVSAQQIDEFIEGLIRVRDRIARAGR